MAYYENVSIIPDLILPNLIMYTHAKSFTVSSIWSGVLYIACPQAHPCYAHIL